VADLLELCRAAVEAAAEGESVEAFAEESRRTEVKARASDVEGLTFAESRGVGVRVIAGGRLGYSYAADPALEEVRETVARARENSAFATANEYNELPEAADAGPMPELFREEQATLPTDDKVSEALELERVATDTDPRVTKVDEAVYGDAVSRVVVASTRGIFAEYERTDCWAVVVALAEDRGETQTGYSFRIGRELADLDGASIATEAVDRATSMLGARKPETARVPVVLDPFAGSSFLGVLASALSAEQVQKGRSLFAELVGEAVGSEALSLVDDGRLLEGPAAGPFDDEGVPTRRTELFASGVLQGFLHNTYTARRGGTASTGNARRGGYMSTPGVGTSNLYVPAGDASPEALLEQAEGGVLIRNVSGVHSGANPISGQFSVGATGLRIRGGAPAEPLREMTIASTLPDMLRAVAAVGSDLRFFTSIGVPSVLFAEMTVAGTSPAQK